MLYASPESFIFQYRIFDFFLLYSMLRSALCSIEIYEMVEQSKEWKKKKTERERERGIGKRRRKIERIKFSIERIEWEIREE